MRLLLGGLRGLLIFLRFEMGWVFRSEGAGMDIIFGYGWRWVDQGTDWESHGF
jgi:hypothetical protein